MIQQSHSEVINWKVRSTQMFIAPLFTIVQTREQPRCPSAGEWVNKLCYIQAMGCHSMVGRKELSSHEKTWDILECRLLSKRSQSEKAVYYMIPTIWPSGKAKTVETVRRSVAVRGWGREQAWISGAQEILQSSEAILYDTAMMDTWHYTFVLAKPAELYSTKSEP